jgi:hypothetical protein
MEMYPEMMTVPRIIYDPFNKPVRVETSEELIRLLTDDDHSLWPRQEDKQTKLAKIKWYESEIALLKSELGMLTPEEQGIVLKCDGCGKLFKNKAGLNGHKLRCKGNGHDKS